MLEKWHQQNCLIPGCYRPSIQYVRNKGSVRHHEGKDGHMRYGYTHKANLLTIQFSKCSFRFLRHLFLCGYNLDLLFSQRAARNPCIGTKVKCPDMGVESNLSTMQGLVMTCGF